MIRLASKAVLIFLFFLATAFAKSVPSLHVDLRADVEPTPDSVWAISVVVNSLTEGDVRLSLVLPAGVSVLDGKLIQTVVVTRGQSVAVPFLLQLPGALEGNITVKAEIGDPRSVYFSAVDEIVLNVDNAKKPAKSITTDLPQEIEREGETLREHTLSR